MFLVFLYTFYIYYIYDAIIGILLDSSRFLLIA